MPRAGGEYVFVREVTARRGVIRRMRVYNKAVSRIRSQSRAFSYADGRRTNATLFLDQSFR